MLCTPALVYLVLVVICMVGSFGMMPMGAKIGCILFVVFWTYVLQMLCKNNMKSFAWFLVILPILAHFMMGHRMMMMMNM